MKTAFHNPDQPGLLDDIPAPRKATPIERRYQAMTAAERKACELWQEAYPEFIMAFAETHFEFSAEDVRLAYCADPSTPKTHKEQASGGIFVRLVNQGKLRRLGKKRSVIYGNDLTTYTRA